MEQYIYTQKEKRHDIEFLIERINGSDNSLCDEDWRSLTFHYDLDIIEFVYKHIEVESMLDVVTDIILKEYRRLSMEGKIDAASKKDNDKDGSQHFDTFKGKLESFANRRREQLALKREEQETRKQYSEKLKKGWFTNIKLDYKSFMDRFFWGNRPVIDDFDKQFAQLAEVSAALRKPDNKPIGEQKGGQEEVMDMETLKSDYDALIAKDKINRREIEALRKEIEELKGGEIPEEPEQAFNPSGNECFTKAKMGLLIYTIASIVDVPIPIKKSLVPIISAIGGWETTSVDIEMKKAGFNKKDIETLAELFKDAMPNFAAKIKKQTVRKPKLKK